MINYFLILYFMFIKTIPVNKNSYTKAVTNFSQGDIHVLVLSPHSIIIGVFLTAIHYMSTKWKPTRGGGDYVAWLDLEPMFETIKVIGSRYLT